MDLLIPLLLIVVSIIAIGKGSDWLTDSLIPIAFLFYPHSQDHNEKRRMVTDADLLCDNSYSTAN